MSDEHWPGGIAPRRVAAEALEELRARKPKTAAETYAIIDEVILKHAGCAADIVRSHIEAIKGRKRT